jgi:hypothetical protein
MEEIMTEFRDILKPVRKGESAFDDVKGEFDREVGKRLQQHWSMYAPAPDSTRELRDGLSCPGGGVSPRQTRSEYLEWETVDGHKVIIAKGSREEMADLKEYLQAIGAAYGPIILEREVRKLRNEYLGNEYLENEDFESEVDYNGE